MRLRLRATIAATAATAALLLGCVGATTQLPPLPPGAIEAEEETQRQLSIQNNERQQARLDSITYPILARATPLCPADRQPLLGLRLATVHNYEKEWQPAAAHVLGLGDTLTVSGVVPGGSAARAGLLQGDRILSVGGNPVPSGPKATTAFAEAFADLIAKGGDSQVEVLYSRAGAQRRATVPLTPVCAYGTVLVNTGQLNAFADGERIYVTSTMMRFASDEELRVVVAHEFAHNVMKHIEAKKKNALFGGLLGAIADVFMATQGVNTGGYYTSRYARLGSESFSQDFEREADYVGLYAMALSGASLDAAPRFWRHMAQEDPKSIQLAYTHPTTAERFVRMEHSIREIEGKLARRLALVPERKSGRKGDGSDEGTGALLASKAPERRADPDPDAAMLPESPEPAAPGPVRASAIAPRIQAYAPEEPSEPAGDVPGEVARSNAELSQDITLRRMMDDVRRLGITVDLREVRPGLLSVMVGPQYGMSSTNYNLARLLAAYQGTVEWDQAAELELWQEHRKLGRFTPSGFVPAAAQGSN